MPLAPFVRALVSPFLLVSLVWAAEPSPEPELQAFRAELTKREPRAYLLLAEEAADPITPAQADFPKVRARLAVFAAEWRVAPPPAELGSPALAHGSRNLREVMRSCFFSWRRLYRTAWVLAEAGELDDGLRRDLREIARDSLRPMERGPNNRAYHFALGTLYAAKLFPDEPAAPVWRAYAEAVWQEWWSLGDGYEPGYVGHHFPTIIELGEQLGHHGALAGDRAALVWRRYAAHISPSGRTVSPGNPGGPGDQSDYLEGLAEAARVSRDPLVLGAAQRAWAATALLPSVPAPNKPDTARLGRLVARATAELAAVGVVAAPPPALAEIQTVYPATLREPQRALLSLPGAAGKPYAAFWLHDRGETLFHSHEDQRGSLLHYEVDGARLLGGSTWMMWPAGVDSFIVAPAALEFPMADRRGLPVGEWLPASADLRVLRYSQEGLGWKRGGGPAEQGQRSLLPPDGPGYSWSNPHGFTGAFDRLAPRTATLRVVAIPAEEMRAAVKRRDHMLDSLSFDAGLFWRRDYRAIQGLDGPLELELTVPELAGPAGRRALAGGAALPEGLVLTHHAAGAGRGEGRVVPPEELGRFVRLENSERGPVWRIVCPPGRLDLSWPLGEAGAEFDLMNGLPRAEFAYRIVSAPGGTPMLRAPIVIALDGLRPRSVYLDSQQGGRLAAARAERRGPDAYVEFGYEDCWAAGAAWRRRAVLTEGGALVVLDDYRAAASQGATRAGPVWQFGTEPRCGGGWFAAPGRENVPGRGVRVTVAGDRPLEHGVQRLQKFQREVGYAASGSRLIETGREARFASVIEPWPAEADGADRPARVEFSADGAVRARLADGGVVVFLPGGDWRVEPSADRGSATPTSSAP